MALLELSTDILAPIERGFDLGRSIDLHVATAAASGERAVAGVTTGLIGLGEEVSWRATHFGIRWQMTSRITALERPRFFQDCMVRGPFAVFEHSHSFEDMGDAIRMHDELRFEAPLGVVGRLVAERILAGHLTRFLVERNAILKRVAEDKDAWREYLAAEGPSILR